MTCPIYHLMLRHFPKGFWVLQDYLKANIYIFNFGLFFKQIPIICTQKKCIQCDDVPYILPNVEAFSHRFLGIARLFKAQYIYIFNFRLLFKKIPIICTQKKCIQCDDVPYILPNVEAFSQRFLGIARLFKAQYIYIFNFGLFLNKIPVICAQKEPIQRDDVPYILLNVEAFFQDFS